MNVVILHNEPADDSDTDEWDVIVQRDAVAEALRCLGHEVDSMPCSLDLKSASCQLADYRPDVVVNLVESLGGTDRLCAMACMLLEAMEIPYTGSDTQATFATSNKLTAKKRMCDWGLPTPAWQTSQHKAVCKPGVFDPHSRRRGRWIIKPVLEHASFAMDDQSVVTVERIGQLGPLLQSREAEIGRPHFAERFIDGREFNLSVLGGMVLPAAEIVFHDFPSGKPRIVGHAAKWEPESFEYQQTKRRFRFPASDRRLIRELGRLAKRCWSLFSLAGYARIDFRVDNNGQPWILEVNTNPCLSPDAGFAAAVEQSGIPFYQAIQTILQCAVADQPSFRNSVRIESVSM